MGEAAIVSHMLGQKHRRLVTASTTQSLTTFMARTKTTTPSHEATKVPIDQR